MNNQVVFGTKHRYAFTTGAHIAPVQINGKWRWIVTEFEDDTFVDGELVNPDSVADTEDGLIKEGE